MIPWGIALYGIDQQLRAELTDAFQAIVDAGERRARCGNEDLPVVMAHDRHVLWDAKAAALEHADATTGELVVAADDGIEGHVTRQPDLFRVSLASHQIIYRPTYYAGGRVEQEDLRFWVSCMKWFERLFVRRSRPARLRSWSRLHRNVPPSLRLPWTAKRLFPL